MSAWLYGSESQDKFLFSQQTHQGFGHFLGSQLVCAARILGLQYFLTLLGLSLSKAN